MKTDSQIIINVKDKPKMEGNSESKTLECFGLLNGFALKLKSKIFLKDNELLSCESHPVPYSCDEYGMSVIFLTTFTIHCKTRSGSVGKAIATTYCSHPKDGGKYSVGLAIFGGKIYTHSFYHTNGIGYIKGHNFVFKGYHNNYDDLTLEMSNRLTNSLKNNIGKSRRIKNEH